MTDATKLLNLFKTVGAKSSNQNIKTIASLMKSVKGMQAGITMRKQWNASLVNSEERGMLKKIKKKAFLIPHSSFLIYNMYLCSRYYEIVAWNSKLNN